MTYDLYRQFNFQKVLNIIYSFCYCIAFVNCPLKKTCSFFIMSSFVLCDTLSGYLERPNNSDSNIIHCCNRRHVYILVALVQRLTELILNVQKYSDKWLWSQLKIIHSYCFSITYYVMMRHVS